MDFSYNQSYYKLCDVDSFLSSKEQPILTLPSKLPDGCLSSIFQDTVEDNRYSPLTLYADSDEGYCDMDSIQEADEEDYVIPSEESIQEMRNKRTPPPTPRAGNSLHNSSCNLLGSNIEEETALSIRNFIMNQPELVQRARGLGQSLKLSAKAHEDLPLSITLTPDGRVYVHAKTELENDGKLHQKTLGKGNYKKVKVVVDLDTGIKYARGVITLTGDDKRDARSVRALEMEQHYYQVGENHLHILKADSHLWTDESNKRGMITALCDGTLEGVLTGKTGQRLSEGETIKFMTDMASAVDHMHEQGYFHRDIKIDNFLVKTENGVRSVFLADAGLATNRPKQDGPQLPTGFYPFISPDILNDKRRNAMYAKLIDTEMYHKTPEKANETLLRQSDVYALGHAFYAMRNGGKMLPWVTAPVAELKQMTTRRAQAERGYAEPKDRSGLDHLIWEMVDPHSLRRITLKEVQTRLQTLC